MKTFFSEHKKLHIWLGTNLALLALYFALRGRRAWMNALTRHVTDPVKRALGALCARVPFSVMELTYVLAGLAALAYLVWSVRAVLREERGRRGRRACGAVLGAADIVLSVYALFCLMWGVNFWTDSFQERSGVYAQPVELEDLERVTAYAARRLDACADRVERDGDGVFAVPMERILAEAPAVYGPLTRQFPFLAFDDPGVKPMFFSRLMSVMGFTGVYFACLGESNVNVDSPACLLPATVAHELAHQRSVASEQECNFLGVLAAVTSGMDDYTYSGWLLAYIHLGNALYTADPERYWKVYELLPEAAARDLAVNNAYWEQFEDNAVEQVSEKVYDAMLKSYGDERGIQSYGTVVDLLVAYYKDAAQ